MTEQLPVPFGTLLRQLRTRAGLTQEELALAAQVSPRAVSDWERGINHTARKESARLLADALELNGTARAYFEATARGRAVPDEPGDQDRWTGATAATQSLPRDIGSFTGRAAELRELAQRAVEAGGVTDVVVIGGMAGVGKTALAVHAAHRLAPHFPDGQIFLPLHGHAPGQQAVDPRDALGSLLQTTGIAIQQVPQGLEERVRLWRHHVVGKRILIVLDDAIGHEQIRPLLPGSAGSLVLITSRRQLTALEDVAAITLDPPSEQEAAEMFRQAAARRDLDPGDPAVDEVTRQCGYLPLAIKMLASQLRHHPVWTVRDLSADIAAARDRLEPFQAENLSVATAFDLSYRDLTADQRRMFRRIGLHPGTTFDLYAAAALDGTEQAVARRHLEALFEQHLLTEPVRGRYRLHDLIREHARSLAATDQDTERDAAVTRLLDYYLATARSAGRHLARRVPSGAPDPVPAAPACGPDLASWEAAVSWLNAELANLYTAVAHAVGTQPAYAVAIPAALHGFLRGHGDWDQVLGLLEAALGAARLLPDPLAQAQVLADLGEIRSLSGDHAAAEADLTRAHEIYLAAGDQLGQANVLHNLGSLQQRRGEYGAATQTLTRALDLHRGLGNQLGIASVLNNLGSVQYRTGHFAAATQSLTTSLRLQRGLGNRLGEANALNELGVAQTKADEHQAAVTSLSKAVELHRGIGHRLGEANATRDLGVAQGAAGQLADAAASLAAALRMQRELGNRFGEANANKDMGIVHLAAGDDQAAAASLDRALELYHALGAASREAEVLAALGTIPRRQDSAGEVG